MHFNEFFMDQNCLIARVSFLLPFELWHVEPIMGSCDKGDVLAISSIRQRCQSNSRRHRQTKKQQPITTVGRDVPYARETCRRDKMDQVDRLRLYSRMRLWSKNRIRKCFVQRLAPSRFNWTVCSSKPGQGLSCCQCWTCSMAEDRPWWL